MTGGLLLVSLAAVIVLASYASGAPNAPREMTFIDRASGHAFVLQVEPGAPEAGSFTFRAPGTGLYQGTVGSAMRARSPRSITIDYEGPAMLVPRATPEDDGGEPVQVTVRLLAQVDPQERQAEVTLRHDGSKFHLNTRRNASGGVPLATLEGFETAMLASDWATLYGLMNRDVRSAYTVEEFAAQGTAEEARVGHVVGIRRLSVSRPDSNDDGAVFVVVSYDVDRRSPSGLASTTRYDAYFIAEPDWRIWYTAAR